MRFFCFFLFIMAMFSAKSIAEELTIAVASNFIVPMNKIITEFEAETGHRVQMSVGSSGKLYSQIRFGAPFDIFFSADQKMPMNLEAAGLTLENSRFTYAEGRLVFWINVNNNESTIKDWPVWLQQDSTLRIAIANPKLAPYGLAAQEVLQKKQMINKLKGRIINAENISQAFQYVSTGNVQGGFISKSQLFSVDRDLKGNLIEIPRSYHNPIKQDAVILARTKKSDLSLQFVSFIQGEKAKEIIQSYGYEL